MEVIIVILIIALVTAVAVRGFRTPDSPGIVRLKLDGKISTIFKHASIRSQSFKEVIQVTLKPEEEKTLTFTLKTVKQNSEFTMMTQDDKSEEETQMERERELTRQAWSGEDSYELDEEVKIKDHEDLMDEEGEIHFFFFPDGEATGPKIKLSVGELEFDLLLDRLNSQVNLKQSEE